MQLRRYLPLVLILGFALSACASTGNAPEEAVAKGEEAMMEEEVMEKEEMTDAPMDDGQDDMESEEALMDQVMMAPGWFSVPLTDVHTGTSFTIQDLKGQVVLVETMAVWCPKCLSQQREVQALHAVLGERDDFTSIALDIDPNEDAEVLRSFASKNGFDWFYAVAPAEIASQLGELYGQQFLNPPSTPILLIDRHGEVHLLPMGIKTSEELQASVESLLDGEM